MKPYGRLKNIKGCGRWKEDYHIHDKNKKVGNWWEDLKTTISRRKMKQDWKREIDEDFWFRNL